MSEDMLSNRYFRKLSDAELLGEYVPGGRFGRGVNCGRAWREIKRRGLDLEKETPDGAHRQAH
jgi:hypothetical protein